MGFASGSGVSGSTCTLGTYGNTTTYYLIASSESTTMKWQTMGAYENSALMNVNSNLNAGAYTAAVATGSGSTLAIPANLGSQTWTVTYADGFLPSMYFDGN
jgi:hypothetical protein